MWIKLCSSGTASLQGILGQVHYRELYWQLAAMNTMTLEYEPCQLEDVSA